MAAATVYHPTAGALTEITLSAADVLLGVAWIDCRECWPPRSGRYELPDRRAITCVRCKGLAREPVMA
jgi:hypothetical protein